ncbi:xylulose kinase-like isoform X2 [Copidosoma floridanum]|nr:xylulose kinase-like isoform X2 [Copidosoma floridanum]
MWVKALDMILDRLRVCGVDFGKVAAISGSAQQHGTVYWGKGSRAVLQRLDPEKFLHEQLASAFSVSQSPTWMDSSTTAECKQLERVLGGPEKLAEITGSRGYERFSGAQIMKIHKKKPDAYENTERVSLVSNFAASLFLGDYAPIDWADASGTNLFDLRAKVWRDELLEACAPNLRSKLDDAVSSSSLVGPISRYYTERFGFDDNCKVVAFTGDNPGSLAGMRLKEGDVAVSLGTSDTLFLWLHEPKTTLDGHILCNPLQDDAYMAMLGFKNGSLTRERIRNSAAGGDWQIFNELLDNTPRGNFGNFALYYDVREITPGVVAGDHRFNKLNERIVRYSSKEVEVRALIEGQLVARRAHAEDFGFVIGPSTRIIATGGASVNKLILQVMADVFNSPVYVLETANSAMMGGAYRAKHALYKDELAFSDIINKLPEAKLLCQPYDDAAKIYEPMVERYRRIIKELLDEQKL